MKEKIWGTLAGLGIFGSYFLVLTLFNGFQHALTQFSTMWYWIVALSVGFGIQVYLYMLVRSKIHSNSAKMEMATSGGVSTASMIACCAHHITDVLPLIGLSAASLFLLKYQTFFLALGLFSNLVGITMMLSVAKEHLLIERPAWLIKQDMKMLQNVVIALAILILPIIFLSSTSVLATPSKSPSAIMETKYNSEGGVTIDVTPLDFSLQNPQFSINFNTHQGSLDFNPADISVLETESGKIYEPTKWEGSPQGGHHRAGTLSFPPIENTKGIELTIKGVYGISERIFTWVIE